MSVRRRLKVGSILPVADNLQYVGDNMRKDSDLVIEETDVKGEIGAANVTVCHKDDKGKGYKTIVATDKPTGDVPIDIGTLASPNSENILAVEFFKEGSTNF